MHYNRISSKNVQPSRVYDNIANKEIKPILKKKWIIIRAIIAVVAIPFAIYTISPRFINIVVNGGMQLKIEMNLQR
jgi:hypothetical protein